MKRVIKSSKTVPSDLDQFRYTRDGFFEYVTDEGYIVQVRRIYLAGKDEPKYDVVLLDSKFRIISEHYYTNMLELEYPINFINEYLTSRMR